MKNPTPFAGCFRANGKQYVLDVNTGHLLQVEERLFRLVADRLAGKLAYSTFIDDPEIRILISEGYFSSKRPSCLQRQCKHCIERDLRSGLQHCTLEVTQKCNHSCIYCPYSHLETARRPHGSGTMSWEVARSAIDYLAEHSVDTELPALGFYGGEPLLAWGLVRECLEYSKVAFQGRRLHYAITTNATLITREIAEALREFGVTVLVSLDGPEEVHNSWRKMRGDKRGSYYHTMRGLELLREAYGEDRINVMTNAVYGPWTDYQKVEDFFERNPPAPVKDIPYRLSWVGHTALESFCSASCVQDLPSPEQAGLTHYETRWATALVRGEVDSEGARHRFLRKLFQEGMRRVYDGQNGLLPDRLGSMGMCTPGVRKFYVDVLGAILPCERVSEKFVIGNILNGGIDSDKCAALLDRIVELFQRRCLDCVLCRFCVGCIGSYQDASGDFTEHSIDTYCSRQRDRLSSSRIEYAAVLDLNPHALAFLEPHDYED